MDEIIYYKRNVGYTIVVRRNMLDSLGVALNNANNIIAIRSEELRDFKIANKKFILDGLIVPTVAPDTDWETPNALTDEDIDELLKNHLKLKSVIKTIDSVPTLARMLEAAREQDRGKKTKELISNRLSELGEETEVLSPSEMLGVGN